MEHSIMTPLAAGAYCRVDRGPNWLFVKASRELIAETEPRDLCDDLWSIAERHFVYRIVLEMEEAEDLPEEMSAELSEFEQRLADHGGALRICGLNDQCQQTLAGSHLGSSLKNHSSRLAAVGDSRLARDL
jgi:hypothetical protein